MNNTYITAAVLAFLIVYIIYREVSGKIAEARKNRALASAEKDRTRKEELLQAEKTMDRNTAAIELLIKGISSLFTGIVDEIVPMRTAMLRSTETAKLNTEAVDRCRVSFEASGADASSLLAGTLKACEAIAASTTELRQEVGVFAKLLTGGSTAEAQREEAARELSADVHEGAAATFANILRGIPLDRAAQIERDMLEKKTMMSATGLSEDE